MEQINEVSELNSSDTEVLQPGQITDKHALKISQDQTQLHRSMGDELFTKSPHSNKVVTARKDHKVIHVEPFVKQSGPSPLNGTERPQIVATSMAT